jgi:Putative transposase
VLDYLGRYTHRVAISNERILGIDGHEVLLRVRADSERGRKRTLRIAGTEFIDRFLQHVLPCGFKRIRHYGLLSAASNKTGLAAARAALDAPIPPPVLIESVAAFLHRVSHIEYARCPHCSSGQFRVVAAIQPEDRLPHPRGPP